jgi:hypothetical protein
VVCIFSVGSDFSRPGTSSAIPVLNILEETSIDVNLRSALIRTHVDFVPLAITVALSPLRLHVSVLSVRAIMELLPHFLPPVSAKTSDLPVAVQPPPTVDDRLLRFEMTERRQKLMRWSCRLALSIHLPQLELSISRSDPTNRIVRILLHTLHVQLKSYLNATWISAHFQELKITNCFVRKTPDAPPTASPSTDIPVAVGDVSASKMKTVVEPSGKGKRTLGAPSALNKAGSNLGARSFSSNQTMGEKIPAASAQNETTSLPDPFLNIGVTNAVVFTSPAKFPYASHSRTSIKVRSQQVMHIEFHQDAIADLIVHVKCEFIPELMAALSPSTPSVDVSSSSSSVSEPKVRSVASLAGRHVCLV